MFNRRKNDDLAAVQEIVTVAANRAMLPGTRQSAGNASGTAGTVMTPLYNAKTEAYSGDIHGFVMDVDVLDDPKAVLL